MALSTGEWELGASAQSESINTMSFGWSKCFLLATVVVGIAIAQGSSHLLPRKGWIKLQRSSHLSSLPVVLWHGMGDSCCDTNSIGYLKELIEQRLGVYVYSIGFGNTESADIWSSFFGNVNEQVDMVCAAIRADPNLADGYNAVGFSQGGQFLRAVVERCQHAGPKCHTLVTFGGQHQGVANIPGCREPPIKDITAKVCDWMQAAMARGAYAPWVRDHVVQAQYVKDPWDLKSYLRFNTFLPDINNEWEDKNDQHRANLASLDKLVLLRFTNDTTVIPRDSAWFSFFNGTDVIPLREQTLYTEDWIGLKELDKRGALVMDEVPGPHMHFTGKWFQQNVVDMYLTAPPAAQLHAPSP